MMGLSVFWRRKEQLLCKRLPLARYFFIPLLSLLALTACQTTGNPASPAPAIPTALLEIPAPTSTQPIPTPTALPQATPTPSPLPCIQQGGTIESGKIASGLLTFPMEYLVYLPPCYTESPDKHYPVLYLIHGQTFTAEQWPNLGITDLTDRLIASGELPPFLMVFPHDQVWRQPSEDGFGQVFIEQLIPLIDAEYRTLQLRKYRAVGGLSRGASWAVHFGMKYPDRFGAVGAHSLPVFWEDVPYVKTWLDAIPRAQLPRFFIDVGSNDYEEITNSATWFVEQLVTRDIPHEWHILPGYHEEAYWAGNLELYLRFYTQDW